MSMYDFESVLVFSSDLNSKEITTGRKHSHGVGTRPETQLPQLRVGGQGLYLWSLNHLGRSSEVKDRKNPKKVKCDGWMDRPMDQWMDGPMD